MDVLTKQDLIDFELEIKNEFEKGDLPFLMHLCGGNEEQLISLFEEINEGDWIFSSHRNHYHYLLAGGSRDRLMELIRNGKSMFVFDKKINFLSSSILAGTCCIAAGVAMDLKREGSKNKVWCFIGDGAEDEGHFYEAVCYVSGMDLPCTFIIEDNDRSVDTSKEERRGKFEMPWNKITNCVKRYHYEPRYPHAGTGCTQWVIFNEGIVNKFKNGNK